MSASEPPDDPSFLLPFQPPIGRRGRRWRCADAGDFARTLVRAQGVWLTGLIVCLAIPDLLQVLLLMIFGVGVSRGVHVLGHAASYWLFHGPGTVILRTRAGMAMGVTVPPDGRDDPRVIAGGPLLAGVIGVLAIVLGLFSPVIRVEAFSLGTVFALHLGGLLPGNSDGNRLWSLY